MKQRIGIYAGTFDPVHSGHISFALQALSVAKLDEVHFLPERTPRSKAGVEHYGHRVAMLRQAIKPYADLSLLELVDKQFTTTRTLQHLTQTFGKNRFVFLMGSDAFVRMSEWAKVSQITEYCDFIVSIRSANELQAVLAAIEYLHIPSKAITIVDSLRPEVSSTKLRHAIRYNVSVGGLLTSVARYAKREWLYASIK